MEGLAWWWNIVVEVSRGFRDPSVFHSKHENTWLSIWITRVASLNKIRDCLGCFESVSSGWMDAGRDALFPADRFGDTLEIGSIQKARSRDHMQINGDISRNFVAKRRASLVPSRCQSLADCDLRSPLRCTHTCGRCVVFRCESISSIAQSSFGYLRWRAPRSEREFTWPGATDLMCERLTWTCC